MLTQTLRPFSWNDIVGQKGIVKEMKKRSKTMDFPEVMLFEGASGTGKSTMAFIISALLSDKNPIVHKDGTKDPNPESPSSKAILDMKFNRDVIYKDASTMSKEDVVNLQKEIANAPMFDGVKVVIIDECFHEDTLVTTKTGKKKISDIKEGEEVLTSHGFHKVKKVFRNQVEPSRLCLIRTTEGDILTTIDHLFMTPEGWIKASKLKSGTDLFNMEVNDGKIISRNLQSLWKTLYGKEASEMLLESMCGNSSKDSSGREDLSNLWREILCNPKEYSKDMLERVFECLGGTDKNREKTSFLGGGKTTNKEPLGNGSLLSGLKESYKCKDEGKQPYEQSQICSKDEGDSRKEWNTSSMEGGKRRKREVLRASEKADEGIRRGLDPRVCDSNKKEREWISNLLQSGFGSSREKDSYRNRRENSFRKSSKGERSEKGESPSIIRVESVEVFKQGSNDELFRGYFSNSELYGSVVPMFDLEVEDVHNYVVDDVLVHNCQELSKAGRGVTLTLLEKKRKNTYLILCTMDVEKLDKAVKSRAATYTFKSPSSEDIAELLMTYTDEEHLNLPLDDSMQEFYEKGIFLLAENCEGSVRMAVQNFERCVQGEFFTVSDIEREFSIISTDRLNELILKLVNGNADAIKEIKNFGAKDFYYKTMKVLGDSYLYSKTGYIDQVWKKNLASTLASKVDLYKVIEEMQKSELNGYFREDLFFTSLTRSFFDNIKSSTAMPSGVTVNKTDYPVRGAVGVRRKVVD